ncbi:hypothetical protein BCAR13_940092 [Paraburkholderia caribensis]|nr:hypothetical protein BCAR13_940092 [Paraburkholderia caribensis]
MRASGPKPGASTNFAILAAGRCVRCSTRCLTGDGRRDVIAMSFAWTNPNLWAQTRHLHERTRLKNTSDRGTAKSVSARF